MFFEFWVYCKPGVIPIIIVHILHNRNDLPLQMYAPKIVPYKNINQANSKRNNNPNIQYLRSQMRVIKPLSLQKQN